MDIPKDIREHLVRSRTYLQDNAVDKSLESVSIALRNIGNLSHIPNSKNMEKQINATLDEISNHPYIKGLLQFYPYKKSPLTYQQGKENTLAMVLQEFAKMLHSVNIQGQDKGLQDERLQELLVKAEEAYAKGEHGTSTSYLKRAAAEFETDSLALNHIGGIFAKTEQYLIAAKVFRQAVQCAPKDMLNYTLAINNFILAKDYANAESIFKLALRQFGGHPRTHGRMATLYLLWDKHEEAKAFADMALEADPQEKYAQQVLKILNQKSES